MINFKEVKKGLQKVGPLHLAQSLILLEVAALFFSTTVTVIVEVLIFFLFLGSRKLRCRVGATLRQPMVFMALALYILVSLGVSYSAAPFWESVDMWGGWRKLLLVPLAASVFTDFLWKQRLVVLFIGIMVLSALVSFISFLSNIGIGKFPVGIVVHNHATQGIFFSIALFVCLVLVRFPLSREGIPGWLLKVSAGLLFLNILIVTPGRSGYLALIILTLIFVFIMVRKKLRGLVMFLALLLILATLLVSPAAKNRILKGLDEIKTYESSPELTSMGIRVVMWKNTLDVLQRFEHPVLGYGTGAFEAAYKQQVAGQTGWQGKPASDPHNQYLRILVEYGIIGGILFLGFIFSFFMQPMKGFFYIVAVGGVIVWSATSMFSSHFLTFSEGRFLMIWCGALLSVSAAPERLQDGGKRGGRVS